MNERKKLKKQLSGRCFFQKYLSVNEVRQLLLRKISADSEILFASLWVGCVKIDAVLYPVPDGMRLGYDIFVKDTPDSTVWICYDNLMNEVNYTARNLEQEMFSVLNAEVIRHGLSYTECNFETVTGKRIEKE